MNLELIAGKVMSGIYDGIPTEELDNLAAETCAYLNIVHPDYSILAARISVSNLHKTTKSDFYELIKDLNTYTDEQGRNAKLVNDRLMSVLEDPENRKKV